MSRKIKILDEALASKIAAGEVVERPSSVVKELLENSIDAGASSISIYLAEGGKRLVRVADDGCGISREDASTAFLRHATSKIESEEDLSRIRTLGFRGEALASIAAVAKVTMKTRERGAAEGVSVTVEGAGRPVVAADGCAEGTVIEATDLFYNTPARLKFLRSGESEFTRALDVVRRTALINPHIRFKLVHGASKTIDSPSGTLKERISDIFGQEVLKELIEVSTPFAAGFIGTPALSYPTAKSFHIYINGRWIRDRGITRAVIDGYGALLPPSRYPFATLDIKIQPEDLDVNIHPAKTEVRFKNQRFVYDIVKAAVRRALGGSGPALTLPQSQGRGPGPLYPNEVRAAASGHFAEESSQGCQSAPDAERLEFTAVAPDVKNPDILGLEPIGQLWGEFLMAQSWSREGKADFYIIDQHGAAERIAFEALKRERRGTHAKRRGSGAPLNSQMLLIPEKIETTRDEADELIAAADYLEGLGFEVASFGPSAVSGKETFLIKAVPGILSERGCGALVRELAEELSDAGGSARAEEKIEDALMRIACHSVIRGPRPLTKEEGAALLKRLSTVDFSGHCPHGRPVVKKISRKEIEAMFKR
ncbi:MAG: DNA mismatch repair endonuclease MutL [Deltaproteobacteria bacterium]|nr:DNA mismatch repair endonuclease MutL [Deltaproteobacteria bacterium]